MNTTNALRIARELIKLAKEEESKAKPKPLAVIIKDDVKFARANSQADLYYKRLTEHLERRGWAVELNDGQMHTKPNKDAKLWISHGKGEDRMHLGQPPIRKVFLGSLHKESVTHPKDREAQEAYKASKDAMQYTPPREHWELTQEQKNAVDKIPVPVVM